MKYFLFFATLAALLLVLPVSAGTINITPVDRGCDYIRWNWTPGLDVTDIFIDGTAICGYETTSNTTLVTGLSPGEIHTIDIIAPGDTGSNISTTSPILSCVLPSSGSGGGSDISAAYIVLGVIAGLILTALYIRRKESGELS